MSKKRIQEIMEQRRLNKIASSNAWHAKFVKKGVPQLQVQHLL